MIVNIIIIAINYGYWLWLLWNDNYYYNEKKKEANALYKRIKVITLNTYVRKLDTYIWCKREQTTRSTTSLSDIN